MIPDFRAEAYLERRLGEHGARIEEGLTDAAIRKARMRAAITTAGLADVVIGKGRDGKPMLYREAFAHVYGEPL